MNRTRTIIAWALYGLAVTVSALSLGLGFIAHLIHELSDAAEPKVHDPYSDRDNLGEQ
jgi:hypothetical protein